MSPAVRAAIDIGTVSTRLLVARLLDGRIEELDRRTTITHLGRGLPESGKIQDDAVRRVLACVEEYLSVCAEHGVERLSVVATSAARDAGNGDELLAALRVLGLEPRIISGSEEAALSFAGAAYSVRGDGLLVIDLGGGSTELIFGRADDEGAEVEVARSVDVGSRRVTDMFLGTGVPAREQFEAAGSWITEQFRPFFDGLRSRPVKAIGLAGTATSLVAIESGLEPYSPDVVHGRRLSGGTIADLRERLASMPLEERRAVPGLEPARAEVIVAGALILELVLGMAGLDELVVSEHDILYGLVLEETAGREEEPNRV